MEQQTQAKFISVAKSPARHMMKINVNGQEQWADCSPQVKGFAAKALQEGQDVTITATFVNNRYNISRIESVGGYSQQPAQNMAAQPPQTQTYNPPVHTTQQSAGNVAPPKQYMNPRTPEEAERMTRLSVLSSVCSVLASVPGQVDINGIGDVVETLYSRCLAKVKE